MVLFDNEERAELLQTNFEQLIATIEKSTNIIWPPEETSNGQAQVSQVWQAYIYLFTVTVKGIERFSNVSKVISRLLWFCFITLCDWSTKLAPCLQPMRSKTKTEGVLLARVFPRLAPVACVFFKF